MTGTLGALGVIWAKTPWRTAKGIAILERFPGFFFRGPNWRAFSAGGCRPCGLPGNGRGLTDGPVVARIEPVRPRAALGPAAGRGGSVHRVGHTGVGPRDGVPRRRRGGGVDLRGDDHDAGRRFFTVRFASSANAGEGRAWCCPRGDAGAAPAPEQMASYGGVLPGSPELALEDGDARGVRGRW